MAKRFCVIDCENQKAWEPIKFGDMFKNVLENNVNEEENSNEIWTVCNIALGDTLPEDILQYQGIIISGSHYNCRDRESLTWFEPLCEVIREAAAVGMPRIYGGCFGCQAIGFALGGEVDYNPSKRFVLKAEQIVCLNDSLSRERIHKLTALTPIPDSWFTTGLNLLVSHGDCVLQIPPGAQLLATSPTCQSEMFLAGNQGNIIACQSHPEFDLQYAIHDRIWKGVVEKNKRLNEEEINIAQESFRNYKKEDAVAFMQWMKLFLRVSVTS